MELKEHLDSFPHILGDKAQNPFNGIERKG